jgi:hypothetical protein
VTLAAQTRINLTRYRRSHFFEEAHGFTNVLRRPVEFAPAKRQPDRTSQNRLNPDPQFSTACIHNCQIHPQSSSMA